MVKASDNYVRHSVVGNNVKRYLAKINTPVESLSDAVLSVARTFHV